MQNTLLDLNNYLFASLERLDDEGLAGDKLTEEIGRARAINSVAEKIISNASVVLDAQKIMADSLTANMELPRLLTGDKK
jgi:hypothetical protein